MSNSDFEFRDDATIQAVFNMEVGREQNNHNFLYNRSLPNQHPIEAIAGLREELDGNAGAITAEETRAKGVEGNLENLTTTDKQNLVAAINEVDSHADVNASNIAAHIADKNNPHEVTKAQVGLGNCDNTSDLNKPISTATQTALNGKQNNLTTTQLAAVNSGIDSTKVAQIATNQENIATINGVIPSAASASNQLADKDYVDTADNDLQQQIDAISASSNVTDIVGTHAELEAYDTSTLKDNDIIKVLQDETEDGATTYYRWVIVDHVGSFVLIGEEGPYYTKSESDVLLQAKQDTITGAATTITSDDLTADRTLISNSSGKVAISSTTSTELEYVHGVTSAIQTQIDSKANVNLNNLSATGQAVIETADSTISNYIKEVPQKIKIELSGNDITIKSGSELVFGGTVYTTLTLTEDKTTTISSSLADGMYFVNGNSVGTPILTLISKFGSGAGLPADNMDYTRFYLSTDSTFYYYSNNAWGNSGITYPVCIVKMTSGVASIAKDSNGNDLIFNGMGFVGHHIFVLPDVTGYESNGINADGSMRSIKVNSNALRIIEASSGYGVDSLKRWIDIKSDHNITNWTAYQEVEHEQDADFSIANVRYYVRDLNLIKFFHSGEISVVDGLPLLEYYYDGSTITSFTPRQSVRTATVEMLDKVQDQVDTNTAAIATKQDVLTFDSTPTQDSTNPVTSGGVYTSLSGKASTSLDNLSSAGQMIVDTQNGTISNCILEIPQNIKCSIASNVVTLTTGSILTNTGATYATTTLSANQTYTIDNSLADGNYLLCSNGAAIQAPLALSVTGSGSSLPADGSTYTYFFNVTDKLIYKYADGAWSATSYCYPFALVTMSNGVATFAKDSNGNDMIFNGWCYIGGSNGTQVSTIVFPGIKYFIPDGLNTNGRLKNQEYTTRAVIITSRTSSITNANVCLEQNGLSALLNYNYREVDELPATASSGMICYNRKTNLFYRYVTDHWQNTLEVVFISFTKNATDIVDIQVRQPVRTATVEMLKDKQNDITAITGYDATKTQTLKNVNGVLAWVDD